MIFLMRARLFTNTKDECPSRAAQCCVVVSVLRTDFEPQARRYNERRLLVDAPELFPHNPPTCMKLLFVADLHYALKQFDWLVANAANFNPIVIGGDLLDLASSLDFDVQIVVVEKYLGLIRPKT